MFVLFIFKKKNIGSECLAFCSNLPPPIILLLLVLAWCLGFNHLSGRHPKKHLSPWGNLKVDEDGNSWPSSIFRSDTFLQCLCFPKNSSEEFFIPRTLKFWQSHETAANKSTYLLAQQLLQEFCPSAVDNPPRSVWCPCQCNGYERRVDASRMMSAFFFQKMEVEVQVSCYNL